jgi:hypothetical protein
MITAPLTAFSRVLRLLSVLNDGARRHPELDRRISDQLGFRLDCRLPRQISAANQNPVDLYGRMGVPDDQTGAAVRRPSLPGGQIAGPRIVDRGELRVRRLRVRAADLVSPCRTVGRRRSRSMRRQAPRASSISRTALAALLSGRRERPAEGLAPRRTRSSDGFPGAARSQNSAVGETAPMPKHMTGAGRQVVLRSSGDRCTIVASDWLPRSQR